MKLKEEEKIRGNHIRFCWKRNQMKRRKECYNSQISMKKLDWKFGTNSSFSSSFSFPWKGSAPPALLVDSSTLVPELQFLKR